jgi:CBS domain-containing protein
VGTRDHLLGVVTRDQVDDWAQTDKAGGSIGSVVDREFVHVHPDQPLDVVLDRLSETAGMLPVVSRADAHRVEGIITPESLVPIRDRR